VSGSWQAKGRSRRTRRHARDDPRVEVSEDVRVRLRVGPMEFQLKPTLTVARLPIRVAYILTRRGVVLLPKEEVLAGVNELFRAILITRGPSSG